ncbi:type VI secretion system lipoprotein TssJ [Aquabacter sp. CN5-332]|uniref:type VI secretion system lipoprotein TssJ n=1 Tax=Aquabacter sp. CN5-332 TaxID=3156608 RepID=UPI0032B5FEAD
MDTARTFVSRRDFLRRGSKGLMLGGAMALSGCSNFSALKVTIAGVRILSDTTINPSPTGQASPVMVRIYALRNDQMWQQADFQSLFNDDATALGTSLITKREMIVPPGANIPVRIDLPLDAAFLATVAFFRAIDTAQWRAILPLESAMVNNVQINLSAVQVTLIQVLVGDKPFDPKPLL